MVSKISSHLSERLMEQTKDVLDNQENGRLFWNEALDFSQFALKALMVVSRLCFTCSLLTG